MEDIPHRVLFHGVGHADGWLMEVVKGGPTTKAFPFRVRVEDAVHYCAQVFPYIEMPTRRSAADFESRGWVPADTPGPPGTVVLVSDPNEPATVEPSESVMFWTEDPATAATLMPTERWELTQMYGEVTDDELRTYLDTVFWAQPPSDPTA